MRYQHQTKPKNSGNELIFGIRAVIEAVVSGREIETIYVQRGLSGALLLELKQVLHQHDLTYQQVPIEKIDRITQKNHQGVVAFISPITYQKLENIIPDIYEKGEMPFLLMLDRITDVRNYGAIARTAECMGIHAIIVPQKGSAQTNPDAIKTSAGALFKIPVCRVDSLYECLEYLQSSGIHVLSCTEKAHDTIQDIDLNMPLAVVMGSEEDGISNEIIRRSDTLAKIPMRGEIASLNVSVATGMVLYEALRQRIA